MTSQDEMTEMEKELEEEEREFQRFQRFLGSVVPKSLEGMLHELGVIALYVRAGARALIWIAIVLTAIAVRYFLF